MNVAYIPVRGGSKSIPFKNIKLINGYPLVYWTILAACECKDIDLVYVSTDSQEIKEVILALQEKITASQFEKVVVIGRSKESALDTASTEYAMLEFAKQYEFDHIVLIQATSPLLLAKDLEQGFEQISDPLVDSVLSVVRQKRFIWENQKDGLAAPINYDYLHRPRRQEFDGFLVENGAFYITSKVNLLTSKNRISGRIKAVEMSEDSYYEIDEMKDWIIVEALMKQRNQVKQLGFDQIKLFLTDCDGCLTDGGMYYAETGEELKKFNTKDGMGFELLRNNGYKTGIITKENSAAVKRRAEKLQLDILELGCKDKLGVVITICREYSIELKEVLYIGDDVNDLELMKKVGISCAPKDAVGAIQKVADKITDAKGGEGVIREVVQMLLAEKEKLAGGNRNV